VSKARTEEVRSPVFLAPPEAERVRHLHEGCRKLHHAVAAGHTMHALSLYIDKYIEHPVFWYVGQSFLFPVVVLDQFRFSSSQHTTCTMLPSTLHIASTLPDCNSTLQLVKACLNQKMAPLLHQVRVTKQLGMDVPQPNKRLTSAGTTLCRRFHR
jgi:hypothetical protein